MNKTLFYICNIASILALSGCGKGGDASASLTDFSLVKEEARAYLALKQIPEGPGERVPRTLRNLVERTAMAEIIASQAWPGKQMAAADIKDRRNEILIERYFEEVTKQAVTDEAVAEYYKSNADKFANTRVHLAHILIDVPPDASAEQKAEKLNEAVQLSERLKGGGDFSKAVKEYSGDLMTVAKGGDIGWVPAGAIEDAVYTAAKNMQLGEISAPVETARGYDIVKLLEPIKAEEVPLETVKDKIRYQLQYDAKLKEMERLKQLAADRIDEHMNALGLEQP